ncbi:DUF1906 domain-containing protein [Streptomyces luteolifulvus]|jgi:hypothetical protein|uniref:DUF1906 domain-containing protein n=1 Tax=Streptomyces luteolifulvus TaxID=2615112 RepID=A0A6H9UQ59_9ACTN|nr:DUF1906 domain-containing protein [Streptomyces luteolifulvus]KAB1140316.1 DUF1906 domain-containing protein [Streptomyces luteolifulvus]
MRSYWSKAAVAVLPVLGLAALAGAPAQADPTTTTRQVDYRGHRFTVPASWPVVDLDQNPRACVRFDRHALYLGHPGADQDCPSHAVGRTEALLVEPDDNTAAEQGTEAEPVERQYRARTAEVTVTATYDKNPELVRAILTGAEVMSAAHLVPVVPPAPPRAVSAVPASATDHTGHGFDTCTAPSSAAMRAWRKSSPYRAVGIYIGGSKRACSQPNLTESWVREQAAAGWRFVPLYVGRQASGITSPAVQGASAAQDAIVEAVALGFGPGSVLYYDMEAYPATYTSKVLAFQKAWTEELHSWGFLSGWYSSSSSGIADLVARYGDHTMPDVIYDGLWNGFADTYDPLVPSGYWADHRRIHQYSGGHRETWGGTTIEIDQDYLDVRLATDSVSGAQATR